LIEHDLEGLHHERAVPRRWINPRTACYMFRVGGTIALVLWVAFWEAHAGSTVRVALKPPRDEAERFMRQGIELRRAGRDEEALELFRRAESLQASPRGLAQMGLAEQALGRWVAADKDLASALQARNDAWVIKNRAVLESARTSVGNHLGRVTILGSPSGATVLINGQKAGTLPLADPVVVAAGEVFVAAEAPGFVSINRKITVDPRGLTRETIDLPAGGSFSQTAGSASPQDLGASGPPQTFTLGGPSRAVANLEAQPEEPAANTFRADGGDREVKGAAGQDGGYWTWQRSFGVGLAGLSVASLAFGIVGNVSRESNASAFKRAGCGTNNLAMGDCKSRYDQVQSAQTRMLVGYVGAIVLGAGGALFLWLSPSEPAGSGEGRALASVISGMTVNLRGRF
jgi:hypothetical protein